jgi:hypothetical protein
MPDDDTFAEASDALMVAIDLFRAAGLTNDEILKELEARL